MWRSDWSGCTRLDTFQGHPVRWNRLTQLCGIWESHRSSIDAPRRCQSSNVVNSHRRDNLSIQQLDFSCGCLEEDRTWSPGEGRTSVRRVLWRGGVHGPTASGIPSGARHWGCNVGGAIVVGSALGLRKHALDCGVGPGGTFIGTALRLGSRSLWADGRGGEGRVW